MSLTTTVGTSPAPETSNPKYQHRQAEIAQGGDEGQEPNTNSWDECAATATTATTWGWSPRGHDDVHQCWSRVGHAQGIRAGKGHGEGARSAKHHACWALLRGRAGTGVATKMPQEGKREVIVWVTTDTGEGDTGPRADGEVGRWAGHLALRRTVDRDGARGWRGISTSRRIGTGESEGKNPDGWEGDDPWVLDRRRWGHTTKIPGKGQGLVSLR